MGSLRRLGLRKTLRPQWVTKLHILWVNIIHPKNRTEVLTYYDTDEP
jgi:hypothetical protein